MKQKLFTFLLIAAAGLTACRKSQENAPDIKQYDQQQIQGYITANGLTGFTRDTTGGDTTGMYYQIINKGTGTPLQYSDEVSLVYTIKSMDGKYILTDTITNHIYNYLGRLAASKTVPVTSSNNLPPGLQLAIKNILKYPGGSMRLLIPSHLAYGVAGYGTGSITTTGSRIAGNQSLDCYIHVISDQAGYDDLVIKNYMTANNLTGYTKSTSGLYYKNTQVGDNVAIVGSTSVYAGNYTLKLLNNTVPTALSPYSFTNGDVTTEPIAGVKEVLLGKSVNSAVSVIIPSRLAYGTTPQNGISANSCLYYDFIITSVTN